MMGREEEIKILITGDLCPHNRIEELVLESDLKSVFNDFIDVFRGNDLNITDLECPLTESEAARPKTGPHQKAHPRCIEILKHAGIGLVAMANNHIMDYGAEGAVETIELCRSAGMGIVGIGHGSGEWRAESGERRTESGERSYRDPFVFRCKGKKVAVLNFADNEFLSVPDSKIQANPLHPVHNYHDIRRAKDENDFVILLVHGGNEFYHLPSPRTKELYRYFTDIGADVIISHHTHCFSGYEIYNGKHIFYGLGNFIYDWPGRINTEWNRGFIVRLKLGDAVDFDIIPLRQGNEIPGVFHLSGEEKNAFNERISELNSIIADDIRLEASFNDYCNKVTPMYDAYIEPYFGKWITALQKRHLFPKLMSRRKRLLLLNIIRCESHREVLLRFLKQYE